MSCTQILSGIAVDCTPSIGGIRVVYVANYADVTSIEVTEGQITNIVLAESAKFKKYAFRRNTATMTSSLAVDATNGSTVSTDLSLSFLKQDTEKRIEMSALSIGELVVLVEDANGKFWYLGKDMPVMASAGGAESGTNYTDGNKYNITLQDNSLDYPYEIKVAPAESEDDNYVNIETIVG